MRNVLTPKQMRSTDATAISDFNIPSIVLMENAARSAAEIIISIIDQNELPISKMMIMCGSGNNGGDGFALARHLHEIFELKLIWIGKKDRMSPETRANFESVEKLGIPLKQVKNESEIEDGDFHVDCLIDSMIGVGGSENLRGLVLPLLQRANSSDALRIAIDSPTGLNTETGKAHQDAFLADITITMYAVKSGMLINDGIKISGEIFTAYLGAPEHILEKFSNIYVHEEADIERFIPERDKVSSKFDYGKVAVVAGSVNMPGAAALCSNAAIASGAGLVYLLSPNIHPAVLPEILPTKVETNEIGMFSTKDLENALRFCERTNVVAIGPGLGNSDECIGFVKEFIANIPEEKKLVIDADALKAIDKNSKLNMNVVLTPHTGEFSAITGIPRAEIEENANILVPEWAKKLNCIIHLKHVPSITSDGDTSVWTVNGNPGMATGGSGDVLSGIIASLMAQGLSPFNAASLGSFIHASAGDYYAGENSEITLTASALIDSLKHII